MKYTIEVTEEEQSGYDFQSSLTGESVQDMIQRRISEIGIGFNHDLKRSKAQELIAKIQEDPDAYTEAIAPIYEAKEAVKAAAESMLLEADVDELK